MKDWLPAKIPPSQPPEAVSYPMLGPGEDYPGSAQSSPLKFRRLLLFLKKFWWIPVLTILLGLGGAVTYVMQFVPATFVSIGTMWETEKLRLPDGAAFTGDLQNYYGTQMELLQSPSLYNLALRRVEQAITNGIPKDKDGKQIRAKVKARQQPRSTVFVLEATSPNAEFSETFLNALMAEYLTYKKGVRKTVSGDTLSSISDQVQKLETELLQAQAAFNAFQRTNNLAMLQEEGTVSGGYLARLKTQLSDLELELRLLDATAAQQEANSTNATALIADATRTSGSGAAGANAALNSTVTELQLLKDRREKLSKYLRPKHPKIAKLNADIERGETLLKVYRDQSREQITAARQAVTMKIESVKGLIADWEKKVTSAKELISEADRLRANVGRSQGLYDRLSLMLQNVDISRNIDQETLAVLQPASAALRTYSEEKSIIGIGAFLGLAIGLGIIFLIQLVDDRFTSPSEVVEKFGDSLVGQVPEIKAYKKAPALLNGSEPHMFAESYRSLRSALLFCPIEQEKPRVLLVTSAVPNEGKSTVAANLAKSIALGGSRVLLVDGDLRRGHLHTVLGLKNETGLAELLQQKQLPDTKHLVQNNGVPGFNFLSRGATPRNPGDLFLSQHFDQLLAQWRFEYDYVIIDSCPVFAADDPTTMAPKVDGTLFVVRRGFSKSSTVREALELLTRRQAKVLGLVFNRADSKARSYYFYNHKEYAEHKAES